MTDLTPFTAAAAEALDIQRDRTSANLATAAAAQLAHFEQAVRAESEAEIKRLTSLLHAKEAWIEGAKVDLDGYDEARAERDGLSRHLQDSQAEVARVRAEEREAVARLTATLRQIQQWDCLNPPADWIADAPWLKRLVDDALGAES